MFIFFKQIGIVCLKVAKASGATKIVITDIDEKRLEFAKQCGATLTINIKNTTEEKILNTLEDEYFITQAFECNLYLK